MSQHLQHKKMFLQLKISCLKMAILFSPFGIELKFNFKELKT